MKIKQAESTQQPTLIDKTSSKSFVYVRSNVQQVDKSNNDGTTTTYYQYDETKYTNVEYEALVLEQTRADVDYISIMTGVDLDV